MEPVIQNTPPITPPPLPQLVASVKGKATFPYKKILLFGVVLVAAILPVIFFVSSLKDSDSDITRIAHLSLTKERIDDAMRR